MVVLCVQVEVQGSDPYSSNPSNRSHYRLQVTPKNPNPPDHTMSIYLKANLLVYLYSQNCE